MEEPPTALQSIDQSAESACRGDDTPHAVDPLGCELAGQWGLVGLPIVLAAAMDDLVEGSQQTSIHC